MAPPKVRRLEEEYFDTLCPYSLIPTPRGRRGGRDV
jgi:hypothetical protein